MGEIEGGFELSDGETDGGLLLLLLYSAGDTEAAGGAWLPLTPTMLQGDEEPEVIPEPCGESILNTNHMKLYFSYTFTSKQLENYFFPITLSPFPQKCVASCFL